jgi:predicted  nucleic acid-binding Zn-ribbon protein
MKLVDRIKDIWGAPERIGLLIKRVNSIDSSLSDLEDEDARLDREQDEIAESIRNIPDSREFEKLGGEVEDLQGELVKLSSRIEDMEGGDLNIDIPELFDLLQKEADRRLKMAQSRTVNHG